MGFIISPNEQFQNQFEQINRSLSGTRLRAKDQTNLYGTLTRLQPCEVPGSRLVISGTQFRKQTNIIE